MDFDDTNEHARTKDSGVALPLAFQQSLRAAEMAADATSTGFPLHSNAASAHSLPPATAAAPTPSTPEAADRVLTVSDLEERLQTTSAAILHLQKQIVRGEETYYEETQQVHGSSLFRGFDTFIDSRADMSGAGLSGGGSSGNTGGSNSGRRMPGDYRWFSSSCSHIAKHIPNLHQQQQHHHHHHSSHNAASSMTGNVSSFSQMSVVDPLHVQVVHLTKEPRKKVPKKQHTKEQPQPKQPQIPAAMSPAPLQADDTATTSETKKRPLDDSATKEDGNDNAKKEDTKDAEEPKPRPKKEAKTESAASATAPKGRASAPADSKKGSGKGGGGGRPTRKRKSVG